MRTVEFKYDIGEQVRICALDRPGVVLQMNVCDTGKQYQVAYWNDGNRKVEWLLECEITPGNVQFRYDEHGQPAGFALIVEEPKHGSAS